MSLVNVVLNGACHVQISDAGQLSYSTTLPGENGRPSGVKRGRVGAPMDLDGSCMNTSMTEQRATEVGAASPFIASRIEGVYAAASDFNHHARWQ